MMGALARYANTLRLLSASQLWFQAVRRAQARFPTRIPTSAAMYTADALEPLSRCVTAWGDGDGVTYLERARQVAEGSFAFLNHSERLPEINWNVRHVSHLWNYNLHYFDYALHLAQAHRLTGERRFSERFQSLAHSWISCTRPGTGDGWDPYVISVRTVNWIVAASVLRPTLDAAFATTMWRSIASQLAFLESRLELHLRANHLQRNYRALFIGGLVFQGPEAERWRRVGAEGLWSELREQVLNDGGHFERSPMYHMIALADYLECVDLARACGETIPSDAIERLGRMTDAASVLARPDGMLHLFNDAANCIAPPAERISSLAKRVLGRAIPRLTRALDLPDTGYFGFADPDRGERILVDCGEPGPAYQPGHGHCDLLSFELDLAAAPFIVDSGTSGYEGDPLRAYQRGTSAHNTVAIDDTDQMEVWSTFRVARRAVVGLAGVTSEGSVWCFRGSYSPFHLRHATHTREIIRKRAGHWQFSDTVSGARGRKLTSWLHFHPDWDVTADADGFTCICGSARVRVTPFGVDRCELVRGRQDPPQGWYSPEFGLRQPATCLEMTVEPSAGRPFGFEIVSATDRSAS